MFARVFGHRIEFRAPLATAVLALLLATVFVVESHPDPGVRIGQYILSAVSCYTLSQLVAELTLILIGCIPAEQYVSRVKLLVFVGGLGPAAVALAEFLHPHTLVVGFSGASMGLIGFSTLAVTWSIVERPESDAHFLVLSTLLVGAALGVFSVAYGLFVHVPVFPSSSPVSVYHPSTAYLAHAYGIAVGGCWWLLRHYLDRWNYYDSIEGTRTPRMLD